MYYLVFYIVLDRGYYANTRKWYNKWNWFVSLYWLLYLHQLSINVVVQRLGADNLFTGKFYAFKGFSGTSIKRPVFLLELLLDISYEVHTVHKIYTPDALTAVKLIHHLTYASLISHHFSVVERRNAPCNLGLDSVVRATDFFGYLIVIPAVIPSCMDNYSFLKSQVLSYSSFCV